MPVIRVAAHDLPRRPAARVLVVNSEGKVLLLEYCHSGGAADALSGKGTYFTTPGGGRDEGETFLECAARELFEETGISTPVDPRVIATRTAPLLTSSGRVVLADERYFCVKVGNMPVLDNSRWTEMERGCIQGHSWCSSADLARLRSRQLWPQTLDEILTAANGDAPPLQYASTREVIGDLIVEVEY